MIVAARKLVMRSNAFWKSAESTRLTWTATDHRTEKKGCSVDPKQNQSLMQELQNGTPCTHLLYLQNVKDPVARLNFKW